MGVEDSSHAECVPLEDGLTIDSPSQHVRIQAFHTGNYGTDGTASGAYRAPSVLELIISLVPLPNVLGL